ncbi:MAG: 50S ribosomal protein L32 [Candidatus Komeilibacteria bacterium RIFCSPLOWO2_01_FULL_45_10]|uniref:Large ribosomal subunit protein bL32 n=1 Tax=Candidatus Komeilibacteria bacterium RIFCSPLOWO2_01_FULL_45_10 TaxID=1798550 RepID=A0A1G2BIJ3_9BACT|nr:MAG: 50S ribosomal protein L32 [Candidatus Komeilibacteria bacterium RIFCSPLOWO2_01_FULL_45_10]
MGLPSHRNTSSSKRRRAAHFALKTGPVNRCPKCQDPIRPHHACSSCGYYKGREVVKIKSKTEKKKK